MSHEKLYEEATKVAAQTDEIVSEAPNELDVKVTPMASEETAGNLIDGVIEAPAQAPLEDLRHREESAEMSLAFYAFASLIGSYLSRGVSLNAQTLAKECERLAREASHELASRNGGPARPNTPLLLLADVMRSAGDTAV